MSLTQLNDDVLLEVISYLPVVTARALSRTCSLLQALALRRALADISVPLGDKLFSFASYVLANPDTRLRWVRSLHVRVHWNDRGLEGVTRDGGLAALVNVLQGLRAFRLSCLRLTVPLAWVVAPDWATALADACSGHTHLADFQLGFNWRYDPRRTAHWPNLLRGLGPVVRTLTLTPPAYFCDPACTLVLLRTLQDLGGLDTLILHRLFICRGANPALDGLTLPNVRVLKLFSCDVPLSLVSRVFPSVRLFRTHSDTPGAIGQPADAASWSYLERLSVCDLSRTIDSIVGRVRTLEVTRMRRAGDCIPLDLRPLQLARIRPLALHLHQYPMAQPDFWQALGRELRDVCTRYLEVRLLGDGKGDGVLRWARSVSPYLATVPLLGIRVILEPSEGPALPGACGPRRANAENLNAAARHLAETIPSMVYVCVGYESPCARNELGWRIERPAGVVTLNAADLYQSQRRMDWIIAHFEHGWCMPPTQ